VHEVGVAGDAARLPRLELSHEVPGEVKPSAVSGLGRGLLVAVLAEVPHPELPQQADVAGGVRLGDRDQGDVTGVAPGDRAGLLDPVPDVGQPGGQLRAPPGVVSAGIT
jgi:hypothetical protein